VASIAVTGQPDLISKVLPLICDRTDSPNREGKKNEQLCDSNKQYDDYERWSGKPSRASRCASPVAYRTFKLYRETLIMVIRDGNVPKKLQGVKRSSPLELTNVTLGIPRNSGSSCMVTKISHVDIVLISQGYHTQFPNKEQKLYGRPVGQPEDEVGLFEFKVLLKGYIELPKLLVKIGMNIGKYLKDICNFFCSVFFTIDDNDDQAVGSGLIGKIVGEPKWKSGETSWHERKSGSDFRIGKIIHQKGKTFIIMLAIFVSIFTPTGAVENSQHDDRRTHMNTTIVQIASRVEVQEKDRGVSVAE
ncbi:15950_t:CDS:2, partial [Acaulospora morrowiae]